MQSYTSKQARDDFSTLLSRVAFSGERVLITRQGKQLVAVIPINDLRQLEALEDLADLKEARASLAEAKEKGSVSWKSLKGQLGL
jgi:prevent-host-death family protein